MTGAIATDIRRAPLATLRSVRFRSGSRDLWADEAAMYDRMLNSALKRLVSSCCARIDRSK